MNKPTTSINEVRAQLRATHRKRQTQIELGNGKTGHSRREARKKRRGKETVLEQHSHILPPLTSGTIPPTVQRNSEKNKKPSNDAVRKLTNNTAHRTGNQQ